MFSNDVCISNRPLAGAQLRLPLFPIEVIDMTIDRVRQIAVAPEQRNSYRGPRPARDALERKGAAARHIVPADHHLSTRLQCGMGRRERLFAIPLVVEPPTKYAVARGSVERPGGMWAAHLSIVPTMCSVAPKLRLSAFGSNVT